MAGNQGLRLALMCPHGISLQSGITYVSSTVLSLLLTARFKPEGNPLAVNLRDVNHRWSFLQTREHEAQRGYVTWLRLPVMKPACHPSTLLLPTLL